jgi:hypothetical protein
VQEERRLQRFGDDVGPEDGPVQSIELGGVLERVERERDQAEEIKMRRAGRAPAAQQDVKTDDEINKTDQAQTYFKAAIERLGNHFDRRIEGNAVASDAVVNLTVCAGAIKGALQIGNAGDGRGIRVRRSGNSGGQIAYADDGALAGLVGQDLFGLMATGNLAQPDTVDGRGIRVRRSGNAGQQISYADGGALTGLVGQNLFGLETTGDLAPPDTVVGLLKLALLQEVEDRQQEERRCS